MNKTWMRAGVAITAAGALGVGMAGTAHADPEDEPQRAEIHTESGWTVNGTDDSSVDSIGAALISIMPEGYEGDPLPTYCIDIHTPLQTDRIYHNDTWDESHVDNLDYVQWVLHNGFPNAEPAEVIDSVDDHDLAEVLDDDEILEQAFYTATQAAVWNFTDGFHLDLERPTNEGGLADKATAFFYSYLVDNAEPMPEPSSDIEFDGPESFDASEKGGPFTVTTPGGDAHLTAEGATLVDADDNEIESVPNGGEFWVVPDDDADEVTVHAVGTVVSPTGAVYLATDEPASGISALDKDESQKLILGAQLEGEVEAELVLTLEHDDKLPVTGSSLTIAALSGLLLLVAGGVTMLMMRRRKVAAAWGDAA